MYKNVFMYNYYENFKQKNKFSEKYKLKKKKIFFFFFFKLTPIIIK